MLAGFLTPTAGAITLLGESGTSGLKQVRGRMGAMIERPIFWPYLSCRDNLRDVCRGSTESDGET